MTRPLICIVTPALADANNGNWQTARRWARLLAPDCRVQLVDRWPGRPDKAARPVADAMLALHARRSADSIDRWAQQRPARPLAVVLTGTDLYRDIHDVDDPRARRSLDLAQRLVVLHERAVDDLPLQHAHKAIACFQSTPALAACAKTGRHLRALMVGHLREEKAPQTFFDAARRLRPRPDIRLDQVGAALDPALGDEAQAVQRDCPAYRWLGGLPHAATRRRIQRAHLLVNCSRIEGGAHVLMEAVRSGTPVLASRIAGNVGMLGADYGGYFEAGDAAALAALLERCRDEPAALAVLARQCAARAPLFEAARERATLLGVVADLLRRPD